MISAETRARIFDAQYHTFDDDLPFWELLAEQTGGPILEMGCGTGRLVIALAQKGYRVLGLDQDEAMLSLAKQNISKDIKPRVDWILGDLANFHLDEPVQLAIGALNTFAYLDDSAFCAALRSAKASLAVDGLITLDLPSFDPDPGGTVEQDLPLDSFFEPVKGTSIELSARVNDQDAERVVVDWLYDELLPDGKVIRHEWEQVFYQRNEEKVRKLVQNSGLSLRSLHGGYNFEPCHPEAERLLVVLEK